MVIISILNCYDLTVTVIANEVLEFTLLTEQRRCDSTGNLIHTRLAAWHW